MTSFIDFVKDWGYIAVFLGSIVEGESVILTASAVAASGYLSIYKIFVISCITTICADFVFFLVGYKFGSDWIIRRFPKLEKARNKAFDVMRRMDILFIFSFRFIYGIRTISPLIIGSAKINPSRFLLFNILSGIIWAAVSCFIGYTIADLVIDGKFDSGMSVITLTVVLALVAGFVIFLKKRRNKKP